MRVKKQKNTKKGKKAEEAFRKVLDKWVKDDI